MGLPMNAGSGLKVLFNNRMADDCTTLALVTDMQNEAFRLVRPEINIKNLMFVLLGLKNSIFCLLFKLQIYTFAVVPAVESGSIGFANAWAGLPTVLVCS